MSFTHPRSRPPPPPTRKWSIPLFTLPILVWVYSSVYEPVAISGRSMSPALNPDSNKLARDWILLDKTATWRLKKAMNLHYGYRRGDVVVLSSPSDYGKMGEGRLLVKRIVALPQDVIEFPLPFLNAEGKLEQGRESKRLKVREGHVWVEGDGSPSVDSRMWGEVPIALIRGKAKRILWPFSRRGDIEEGKRSNEGRATLVEAYDVVQATDTT
ncbi:LexA/Signal peptidase [Atractiella rhizophila]|nr:LexA/Signal peptidase [Atractiella rhizophila]